MKSLLAACAAIAALAAVPAMGAALGLVIAFPEIALWLPRALGYRIT